MTKFRFIPCFFF